MAKQMLIGDEARRALSRGIEKTARAVRVTLGPTGKNVVFGGKHSGPRSTKDGVTVVKEIELADPFENMGAKLIKEVAEKANQAVGDGTTTAAIYAHEMLKEGFRLIAAGVDPQAVKRGIEKSVQKAVESIDELAVAVRNEEDVKRVGTIASNNDETIGELFAEAMRKVGENGVITVEEGKRTDTHLDIVEGMQLDRGYLSPYFVTDLKAMTCVLEDCYIFLYEKKLSSAADIVPILEKVVATGKPMLIVAEDVEGEAMAALIINRLRGVLKVGAIKAPGFGDRRKAMMEDLAILTGGTFLSEDRGVKLDKVQLDALGRAEKVVVTKDKMTLYKGGGKKADVERRVAQIKHFMEQTTSQYDLEKLQERLAKLSGGVAIISVGGMTEKETKERKDRVEDALNATQAAVQEGIIPGGGTTGIRVRDALDGLRLKGDEKYGLDIVLKALEAPLRQIAENVGLDAGEIVAKVSESKNRVGFEGMTGTITDLFEAGVIDPAKVMRVALQSAASVAALIIGAGTAITELKEGKTQVAGSTV